MATIISQFAASQFPNSMIHLPQTKIRRKRTTRLLWATLQRTRNLYKRQQLLVPERKEQSCCKLPELLPPIKTERNQPASVFYSIMGANAFMLLTHWNPDSVSSLWGKKCYIWTPLVNKDIAHKTVTWGESVWKKLVVKKSKFALLAFQWYVRRCRARLTQASFLIKTAQNLLMNSTKAATNP